jgi:hypothetical protein
MRALCPAGSSARSNIFLEHRHAVLRTVEPPQRQQHGSPAGRDGPLGDDGAGGRSASALLDRFTHHIVETGNESYRFRHSSHTAKTRINAREQARLKAQEGATDPS